MPLDPAALLASTGNQQVDTLLCGVIDLVEVVFPGRIRSYHLLGSYSDGSAVQDSDIDLLALFKGRSECEEQERFRRSAGLCIAQPDQA